MVDCPHHPEQEVIFALTEAGVADPEEGTTKKKTAFKKVEPKKEEISALTEAGIADPEEDTKKKNTASKKVEPEKEDTENKNTE